MSDTTTGSRDIKAHATTSFADLGKEMWAYLTGKGAAINYEFVDMTVEVPRETGPESPRATWKLDGTLRMCNTALRQLFGLADGVVGLPPEEVFATATVKPREPEAFVERLRELCANPSEVDESEWELATARPRIVQRYSAPMRNQVG